MGKIMNAITLSTVACCMATTGYVLMKQKSKNMLDIIIEEIETMK